jgi:acetyl-CoA C-acetyltransferase
MGMSPPSKVAVVGVGITKFGRRLDATHPDLAWEATKRALEMAGIWIDDVDAVVYGTMDPFDGVAAPERWDSAAYGAGRGAGKPIIKVTTGGTTGMSIALLAHALVASGKYDVVLATGVQKVSENIEAQQVLNTAVDPLTDRPLGIGAIAVGAMQASAYYFKYNRRIEEYMALVASKNRINALRNPVSHLQIRLTPEEALMSPYLIWPVKLADSCPSSDGAVSVVMVSDRAAKRIGNAHAWVKAVDYIADTYWFGTKSDPADWTNLALLARRIYRKAGVRDPYRFFDVMELYDAFSIQEILEYEALNLAPPGQGTRLLEEGVTEFHGQLPVSPSGGVLSSNPVGVTGLWRFAEAALQVMGRAGEHQVKGVQRALAHAWGGALQFHALAILSSSPE